MKLSLIQSFQKLSSSSCKFNICYFSVVYTIQSNTFCMYSEQLNILPHKTCFGTERNCIFKLEKETYLVACEYSCFSQLPATWDVLPAGTSVTQGQNLLTDDVKSVQNGQEL